MAENADIIRRIELRLSMEDVAKGVKLLRDFIDSSSLNAAECGWAIQALRPYGDDARVERLVRRLVALEPDAERARLQLADFLRESGCFEDASRAYREVLATNPYCGRAIYFLASMGRLVASRSGLASTGDEPCDDTNHPSRTVRSLNFADCDEVRSELPEDLPPEDDALIQFALGKLEEDGGGYEEAMRRFNVANAVAERHISPGWRRFDQARTVAEDDWIRQLFSPSFLKKWRATDPKGGRSIFIVGMPRSGTTLLERILAGHPQVHAAGELSYWTQRSKDLIWNMESRPPGAAPMAEAYERLLDAIAPDATKVVDKNPMNGKLAGALHVLMPDARFIWCDRHPVDHCLSMFKTFGGAPKDLAFSKRLLVQGWRLNHALMKHWTRVLPEDRFLEITYEQLVTDNEATARRVVDFCGLQWSDRCLHDRSGGSVRTPSAWQVRQPIYTSSLESWRHYEPWLDEFRELL